MNHSNEEKKRNSYTPHETNAGVGDQGLETGVPSNYEHDLKGTPKSMTGFEVRKSPTKFG